MVSESNAASAIGSSDPPSPAAGPDGVAPHPAGAAAELFVPCTRSVVRPGVPDFVVPLARVCVARMTYQPGLRFAGRAKVVLIRFDASALVVASTWPLRLLSRSVTGASAAEL